MNKLIAHIDPSICSLNLGDYIISDAVDDVSEQVFNKYQVAKIPSQDSWWRGSYRVLKNADISLVGGTNLLSSNMPFYRQWKISPIDIPFKNEIILLGVGWWQYQGDMNFYTKFLYKKLLSSSYIHSVRDNYTKNKLSEIGLDNVLNTGCPTMWSLDSKHCEKINKNKANSVVATITDYRPDPESDVRFINVLINRYKKVYIWPQGHLDPEYLSAIWQSHWGESILILNRSLRDFDRLLSTEDDLDYVGTRLHAGIRALQYGHRSIILEVDNRAKEKAKTFGLITCERSDSSKIDDLIAGEFETNIILPSEDIAAWKEQFK